MNMEWILEDGISSKQVQTVEDIASAVRGVMNRTLDFLILTPSEPIMACNFMQAASSGKEKIRLEVSLVQSSGVNRLYYIECSPDVAICLLTLYYTEDAVPDVNNWTFEGEYGG